MVTSWVAFILAGILVFLMTPLVRRIAERLDVIDKPDRRRKRHRRLIPLWGGLAIFLGLLPGIGIALFNTQGGQLVLNYRDNLFGERLPYLLIATFLLVLVGLFDDWRPLPPKVKLLVQMIAAAAVVSTGFRIENLIVPLFGIELVFWIGLGWCLAVLWLGFVINAFNFTDGLDGLASSQAVIVGVALSLGALILADRVQDLVTRYQYQLAAVIAAGAAGAALGFLRFNHFPARIFLGDAGSTLLGFALSFSGLLLIGRASAAGTLLFVLLALGWPIFDTVQVILRRLRRGEPISKADNRHLHHYLVERGFSSSAAVALIDMIVLILCGIGLVCLWF